MGIFSSLFGGGSGSKERHRQGGRYGKPGTYRKERNGDRVGRDSKSGKYTKP